MFSSQDCPQQCSSIGAGHCNAPPQSDVCCPFFEPNGTCTTNCSTNFVPNNQTFVCGEFVNSLYCFSYKPFIVECPLTCSIGRSPNAECTACEPTHVCLTDNPCQNGATCRINSRDSSDYTCECLNEFSGQNCDGKVFTNNAHVM